MARLGCLITTKRLCGLYTDAILLINKTFKSRCSEVKSTVCYSLFKSSYDCLYITKSILLLRVGGYHVIEFYNNDLIIRDNIITHRLKGNTFSIWRIGAKILEERIVIKNNDMWIAIHELIKSFYTRK